MSLEQHLADAAKEYEEKQQSIRDDAELKAHLDELELPHTKRHDFAAYADCWVIGEIDTLEQALECFDKVERLQLAKTTARGFSVLPFDRLEENRKDKSTEIVANGYFASIKGHLFGDKCAYSVTCFFDMPNGKRVKYELHVADRKMVVHGQYENYMDGRRCSDSNMIDETKLFNASGRIGRGSDEYPHSRYAWVKS